MSIMMARMVILISRGFQSDHKAYIWLKSGNPSPDSVHIAIMEYDPGYYAAEELDTEGYSVEVVHKI